MLKALVSAILAFLVVAALSYWMAGETELSFGKQKSDYSVTLIDDPCGNVEHLQETIFKKISNSKACKSSQDCIAIHLGCPFGCRTTVNSKYVDELRAMKNAIPDFCPACQYFCIRQEYVIECQSGLCVDVEVRTKWMPRPDARPDA